MRILLAKLALFNVLVPVFSIADEALEKFSKFTPNQILEYAKINGEFHTPYLFAAYEATSPQSKDLNTYRLNRLLYPAISDYETSIKLFQKDLGHDANGTLNIGEYVELERRSDAQNISKLYFPLGFNSVIFDSGIGIINGTLILIDEDIAAPLNHAEVKCSKYSKTCTLEELQVYYDITGDSPDTFSIGTKKTYGYKVTYWDSNIIKASLDINEGDCRAVELNLNFNTKEFLQITTNAETQCETVLGEKMPLLDKPRIAKIVDGHKVYATEYAKIRQIAFDYLSSDYRNSLK